MKNEKQDRIREINEKQLHGQFDNIKSILATNLATNRGLETIKQDIKHYIMQLPHIGSPLPRKWVRVREKLENSKKNYISIEEYFSVCAANDIRPINDCLQLSGYLHDIGVFLHFQDDYLLKKTIILKPKWGTDAVYKVLDNKKVIQNLGRFTREDLEKIWSTKEYSRMLNELLQLMMKFKLCYEIPQHKNTYIAPQLLTENQPDYDWDDEDNLRLRYKYEFMPKGILLQFIVVMSESIWGQNVWKSGVVLEKGKSRAEVIEHYGKREIQVRISGAHRKELMTIIMHELDKIHVTYKRLKYDKLIPCNCLECKSKKEPYFYRFEILQKFVEDGEDKIQCQQSYEMVNVRGLVDDIVAKEYIRTEREAPMAQYIIQGDYINQGDKKMAKIKQTIKGSTIHGSVVAAESIKDSFNLIEKANIKDELKEQLKQLNQAVEAMVTGLPKEKAEEVADDMKRLAEEAVKPSPSKKWYSVSVDGLIKAAENLGKVGEPVVKLAGKVLKSLATV
ncbi:MAG: COR domain-containing protein [Anaerolineales bacterium]